MGLGESPREVSASTSVTWAPHDRDDLGRRQLFDALDALAHGRLERALIPANVAVELTLGHVLTEHFEAIGIARASA